MAVPSITIRPDARRDAAARALVPAVKTWSRGVLKQPFGAFETGTRFLIAAGSKGAQYMVTRVSCTCPDYTRNGKVCKHIRAALLAGVDLTPRCYVEDCNGVPSQYGEGFCADHELREVF